MSATATATPAPPQTDPNKELRDLVERLERANAEARKTNPSRAQQMLDAQQPPGYTKSLGSETKPFSFHRFVSGFALAGGQPNPSHSPHEWDVVDKYTKALKDTNCQLRGGTGYWLPLDVNETYDGQLTSNEKAEKDYNYVKAVMQATQPRFDPAEATWLQRRGIVDPAYIKAAQSAYDDTLGGSLVAPPVQGDVIPIIRPQAAFLAAGATAMTLPPNGRFVRPKITGVPNVRAVGESQETPTSNLTTGMMELTAKKIAGAVILSEESTAFTSGTMDSIAQAELGRSLGLRMDAYAFYGVGGTQIPAGLTSDTYSGSIINIENDHSAILGIDADGNFLRPEYGDIFPALIGERSFNMDANTGVWVMRPGPFATAVSVRADAVATGDRAGVNVDINRRFAEGAPSQFKGRRVVQSTNIANDYTKGTGTSLSDVFYGIWSYSIMASYGAINFQQGHNGSTFLQGQYIIRGTMFGDIGFVYPGAFLWYPNVRGLSNNF